jgi:hypothetical protein
MVPSGISEKGDVVDADVGAHPRVSRDSCELPPPRKAPQRRLLYWDPALWGLLEHGLPM